MKGKIMAEAMTIEVRARGPVCESVRHEGSGVGALISEASLIFAEICNHR